MQDQFPERKTYRRRAFVEEVRVFNRYRPVAEKLVCMAEQADTFDEERVLELDERELLLIKEHIWGDKLPMLSNPKDFHIHTLADQIKIVLGRISEFDKDLVKKFEKIRAVPLSKKALKEGKHEYNHSPRGRAVALAFNQNYREENRDAVNARIRRYARRPEVKKRRKERESTPEFQERLHKRFREYYIDHHQERLEYSRRRRRIKKVQKKLKQYREAYKDRRNKLEKNVYRECRYFISLASHENAGMRQEAAIGLGVRKDFKGGFKQLKSLLADSVLAVKHDAIWAFGERDDWRIVPDLIDVGWQAVRDIDYTTLKLTVESLKKIGTKKANATVKEFEKYLNQPSGRRSGVL